MAFKLTSVKEPIFVLELPDGSTKEYPLWDLAKKIDAGGPTSDIDTRFNHVRTAFGFPTLPLPAPTPPADAPADWVAPPPPFTLTDAQCVALQVAVVQSIQGLDDVKKLEGLLQS